MSVTLSLRPLSSRAVDAAAREHDLAATLMLVSRGPGVVAGADLPPEHDESPRAIIRRSQILDGRRDEQKLRDLVALAGLSLDADLGERHALGSGASELSAVLDLLDDPRGHLLKAGTERDADAGIRILDPAEVRATHAALAKVERAHLDGALLRPVAAPALVRNPLTGQMQQVPARRVPAAADVDAVWPLFEQMRSVVAEAGAAGRGLGVWIVL